MRKIEQKMVAAVNTNKDFHESNTSVIKSDGCMVVRLFGNIICVKEIDTNERHYSNCGYLTATTKSRLNALGCNITQKNYEWVDANTGLSPKFEDLEYLLYKKHFNYGRL